MGHIIMETFVSLFELGKGIAMGSFWALIFLGVVAFGIADHNGWLD